MWTIVEVIYGFEGILIGSDRTQCEVRFETKAFSPSSLCLFLSCLLHCQPSARGCGRRSRGVRSAFCLWAAKCPSNEDNDGEIASLAIFLMTTDVFILSVTPRQGDRCGAIFFFFLQLLFLSNQHFGIFRSSWMFRNSGYFFFRRFHLKGPLHTGCLFFFLSTWIKNNIFGLLTGQGYFHTECEYLAAKKRDPFYFFWIEVIFFFSKLLYRKQKHRPVTVVVQKACNICLPHQQEWRTGAATSATYKYNDLKGNILRRVTGQSGQLGSFFWCLSSSEEFWHHNISAFACRLFVTRPACKGL